MNTERIPTTEEVRRSYKSLIVSGQPEESKMAEFDRWLSELTRKELGEAWLEGWNTGNDYYGECDKGSPKDSWKYDEDQNPYRKEQP